MSMFSLNANDSQQIGRRIFRRPMVFMRHRARRMEHGIARAVGAGSIAGAVAGASVARAGKPATNQPPKKRENTSASMGSRVGSAVGAVMDTKNKVRDSASSLKENVKDLPTQAGYAVHSAKQKAKDNVSGGQQQRVALARALAIKPAIILADEPTGNLDSRTSQDVLGLIKISSQNLAQTIVMITHNEEIAQMADRIIRIEDGKIVKGGE